MCGSKPYPTLVRVHMCKRGRSPARDYLQPALEQFLPPANEVWDKVIFSEACVKNSVHGGVSALGGVCSGGVSAPGGMSAPGGVCSQGYVCSGGVSAPGGCLLWGVSALGGCLLPGGCLLSAPGGCLLPGVWWRHAPRILLRAVRILLECILVINVFHAPGCRPSTERSMDELPVLVSGSGYTPNDDDRQNLRIQNSSFFSILMITFDKFMKI